MIPSIPKEKKFKSFQHLGHTVVSHYFLKMDFPPTLLTVACIQQRKG